MNKLKQAVLYGAAAGLFALKAAGCGDVYITNTFGNDAGSQRADATLDLRAADKGYYDSTKQDSYLAPDAGIDGPSADRGLDGLVTDTIKNDFTADSQTDSLAADSQAIDAGLDVLQTDSYAVDQGYLPDAGADSLIADAGQDSLAADTGYQADAGQCKSLADVPGCFTDYTTLVSAGAEVTKAQQLGYKNVVMDETKFSKGVVSGNPCTLPNQFKSQTCLDYVANQVAGQSQVNLGTEGTVTIKGGLQERLAALELLAGGKLSGTNCTIAGLDPDTAAKSCN